MSLYHPVKIGSLFLEGNLFLAPIAGYSGKAFRSLCVDLGASFCTTEMVSSEALCRGNKKTEILMMKAPNETSYCVQLFGGDPFTMAKACKIVLEKTDCSCIDINAGCPVPKITKTGAGSALIKDPEKLFSVVKAVKDASLEYHSLHPKRGLVPVTIKIRSGWDSSSLTWKECADAALKAGSDAITIHARTRSQGYSGKADWGIQKELVSFVKGKVPVFGSGDALSPEKAKKMLEETGCDAVMFARGAMKDPFLFRRTKELLIEGKYQKETVQERIKAGFKELELTKEEMGEKKACLLMRKKFCAYSSGFPGSSRLREKIVKAASFLDYKEIFKEIYLCS